MMYTTFTLWCIIYSALVDYLSGFCFQYCIFEFWIDLASVIAAAFWLEKDEFEYA